MKTQILEANCMMIDRINTNQIRNMAEQSAPRQPEAAKMPPEDQIDVSLQINCSALVETVLQTPEANPNAVEEARLLIESGKLDTPENAEEAARNMLEFGI